MNQLDDSGEYIKKENKNQVFHENEFEEDITMMERAISIVNNMNEFLYSEINQGKLAVEDDQKDLPIQKNNSVNQSENSKSKIQEVDLKEHKKKVKSLMKQNRKIRERLLNRTHEYENALKISEEQEKKQKQVRRQQQIQKRRQMIQKRIIHKSDMLLKIKRMSLQSEERLKDVKKKKFLYQEKQEEFKNKILLPKIEEEKRILNERKDKMKSIDINELTEHQKSYEKKKKSDQIQRIMTSRTLISESFYNPPKFVPKSYLIEQAELSMKKQQQILKIKKAQSNKEKVKEFVKNISSINRIQSQLSKSRSNYQETSRQKQSNQKEKNNKKSKPKQLSKKEINQQGNNYFRTLIQSLKATKKKKQKQLNELNIQKQKIIEQGNDLQIQIRSESIKTVEKIEKIEKSYKIRSRKIQSIFKDETIDPLMKYQKLRNEVNNFEMVLKSKNRQSNDINERTEVAGCYLNAIKAKINLLEVSTGK